MAAIATIVSSPTWAFDIFVCEPEWKALLQRHAALLRNSVREPNCLQLSNSYTTH
nr:hypothetical protein [Vibrio parahaemolyticus]